MDDEKQLNDKKENNSHAEGMQKIKIKRLRIKNEHKAEEHRIEKKWLKICKIMKN